MTHPTLYSFRRCPYAIRARLALAYAEQPVVLREVLLREKPQDMLDISPKGTVPVLQLPDGTVLEESVDIMRWALQQNDPQNLLRDLEAQEWTASLIEQNDGDFKHWLDRYKYATRHPEHSPEHYRAQAERFLQVLEEPLSQHEYLLDDAPSFADIAILPFIRQFSMVDLQWFEAESAYPALKRWRASWLKHPTFLKVMAKQPPEDLYLEG